MSENLEHLNEVKAQMSESEKSFEQKSKQNEEEQCTQGKRWTLEQNVTFCLFMTFYESVFNSRKNRQTSRIFKKFSELLKNRTPKQCRTHYQKLMNRFGSPPKTRNFFKDLIGSQEYEKKYESFIEVLKPLIKREKLENPKKSLGIDIGIQVNMREEQQQSRLIWPQHSSNAYQELYYFNPNWSYQYPPPEEKFWIKHE